MPGMNGKEMVKRIDRGQQPDLKVLYMSGYSENIEPGLDLLEKPFTSADLLKRVRAAFDANSARNVRHSQRHRRDGRRLCFQLAPALRLPRAQQLVLAPQHSRALGVALDSRVTPSGFVTTSSYQSIASRASHDIRCLAFRKYQVIPLSIGT